MTLSKYERETVIIYNEEEQSATISTLSPVMMRKLRKLAEQSPAEVELEEVPGGGVKCVVPKKYVSVRKPKKLKLSKEQLARKAEAIIMAQKKLKSTREQKKLKSTREM